MAEIPVLVVDDQEAIIKTVKAIFRRNGNGYIIFDATSAAEGLEILAKEHERIRLVISDYEMPEEDGITFLRKVRAMYPKIRRALYTGNPVKAIQAVENDLDENRGVYQTIIQKPFDSQLFIQSIEDVLRLR